MDGEKLRQSKQNYSGTNSPALASPGESEKFVKPMPCSQLNIIQPLEQLHTANLALGIRLERFFENIFRYWGIFVAKNPWSIIIGSIIISLYLAAGVFTNYKVTTDPVDLWVPAGSQARRDMEYFNKKFWKFYRIQQVIIEPKVFSTFTSANHTTYDGDLIHFGPAFNQLFLLQAFDLYQSIKNITAEYNVDDIVDQITLEDICYKPLNSTCAVQSIFTYFGDNISEISGPDYLTRIQNCVE